MAEKVVEIRGLKKSFGDLKVLQGVDLDLFKEENLVVLGKSGSGKSVLIKIMVGLLKQDAGTMHVFGKEVSRLNSKQLNELRLKIGFSFQNSALYDSMTVKENLEFPLVRNVKNLTKGEIQKKIEGLLDSVGLPQTINQMPSELSGGQKKRIGVARTLILDPEIMLYDEPTAGLDPITCMDINNLINEVREQFKTTSIVITHDLTCAKVTGDRMAVLLDGQFKAVGTFNEVFADADDQRVKSFYDYNFIES
ncbi:MAG TPA: ABC transporter ATP-binding protein [Algoriphagus sp.]|jgi:phospholipid/cholesterol/gamma-HCH transport system ATP-binding protein|uniref:ABC transporter ATP-binding protein n=1 Tax=unclassified Algoriphagus TaxID=2641541 RepID=UPI000C3616FA|nr:MULTISPECIES: ATP-binding cassette domain-containing protein [unclassified Algoriphagus]MAL15942.1 ABC transporter ATP-binding protein [Algoriphagus sp.]MAN86716.1 ABC transporter ATP-binding protein [Algoriphagus sp.]QYH39622.1 ATP-binding cassette domain-containing protein [Algoriphagus sp. NBT04N3]HAD51420.1 ABC transporter ATP-binding protein [Algoriphagus sp.]HAS59413.1 ABC transporter ATP-binding protein [Algoriphagus sp.]|tara:strand:- start:1021 stop:1773 length:753 start_codon:yes stop_codon:yes gene_type:complete